MKELPLRNSELSVKVDDDVYDILSKYTWSLNYNGYAYCNDKVKLHTLYKTRRMHRIIYQMKFGHIARTDEIDHIDVDSLNNQLSNLRKVDRKNNSKNRRGNRGSYSRFKGVYWDSRGEKFIAEISLDGKKHYLGSSNDEIVCAKKYNDKAKELFGDYAYLNKIEE